MFVYSKWPENGPEISLSQKNLVIICLLGGEETEAQGWDFELSQNPTVFDRSFMERGRETSSRLVCASNMVSFCLCMSFAAL